MKEKPIKKLLKNFFQNHSNQLSQKRHQKTCFAYAIPSPIKHNNYIFYNNLQIYHNKSVGSVKFIRSEPVLPIDR